MNNQRDVKLASKAVIVYEKQDGSHQIELCLVYIEFIGEMPVFIIGSDSNGDNFRIPFIRVVMIETLSQ
jgi:hypothetical protein